MTKKFMNRAILLALALMLALTSAAAAEGAVYDEKKLDANYALALAFIGREDYDKAMTYLNACLQHCDENSNPEVYADVHLKIACVYTIRQDYEKALAELEETIRVSPNLSEAYLVKTQVYSDMGDYENAAASLQSYIDLTGDTSLYEVKAEIYNAVGNVDKALENYKLYVQNDSGDETEAAYKTGIYDMENGLYEEAIGEFTACLESEVYAPSSTYNIGVSYMRLEKYESALEYLSKVADQDFDGVHYNIGVCSMLLNQTAQAVEAFTASIEKESFTSDALYNRAICNVSLEDFANAIVDFTAYRDKLKAQKAEQLNAQAAQEAQANGTEPAVVTADEVEDVVDIATYYRGVCYLSVGNNEGAIEDFTACIDNGLAVIDSQFNRGLACLQAGEKNEMAKDDFTACIENDYNKDSATFYRSFALLGMGDTEGALADLTACIESGYDLGQSYYQRAQIYMLLGEEDKYIEDLEASLNY